jgi:AcrR family transcriptional regulator
MTDEGLGEQEATRERLIDATIELLAARGNHALRLADVAKETGVAVSTIYAHFRDRTDLVAAARLKQFKAHADEALRTVELGLEAIGDRSEFAGLVFWPSLRSPTEEEGRNRRWDRIEAMADSRHIPELADQLTQLQSALSLSATELSRRAQEQGWIDPQLDPVALSLFTQVLRLGLALWDISGDAQPSEEAWSELMGRLLDALRPVDQPSE